MKAVALFLVCTLFFSNNSFGQNAVDIIDKMKAEIKKLNKVSFEMHSKERFGSKYVHKKMQFNIQESPRKVYMKDLDKGVELLYVSGWNNNKGYINPNGFPWVNVSLNIYDSKVVAENHHTVDDAGFGFVNILLAGFERSVEAAGKNRSTLYTYKGGYTYDGQSCYKIEIAPPVAFKYIEYTTTKDMNLMQLSRLIVASDYLIKVKNGLSYTRTIKAGTKLIVPNAYASKVEVYITKDTYMPIYQILYDDQGLFEQFEYKKVVISPSFDSKEFTTECSNYGF